MHSICLVLFTLWEIAVIVVVASQEFALQILAAQNACFALFYAQGRIRRLAADAACAPRCGQGKFSSPARYEKEEDVYRFYISEEQIAENEITIMGEDVNHIRNVLRLEKGDWVTACDGKDRDYVSRIHSVDKEKVVLRVEKVQETGTELKTKITLFQGIPKKEKMEFIIQKAVELGVYEIVPVMMKRCVVKLTDEKKLHRKQERWQAIAEAAAKQCDRGIIPVVHDPVSMEEAIDMARTLEYNMIPYELQDGIDRSREIVANACTQETVGIFIGPEGGFEPGEVEQAVACGMEPITLGKRILRTETAGMALLAIMMFQMQQ